MQLKLRTIGFRDDHVKRLPYFEHVLWFFWTKYYARMEPFTRDRGFESALQLMAKEARAARFGWWWCGYSRHVVQVTIEMAEASELPVPWTSPEDAQAFVADFCQRAGMCFIRAWDGEPAQIEQTRGMFPCSGTVSSDANGVTLRLWSRSGPRLARAIEVLANVLAGVPAYTSQASTSATPSDQSKPLIAA